MVIYNDVNRGRIVSNDQDHTINVLVNDGDNYTALLPFTSDATEGQEFIFNIDISSSLYYIYAFDTDDITVNLSVVVSTPRKIKFKFVGSEWTLIYDYPTYVLNPFTAPVYALSGNPVLDNDGSSVLQSGVDVVGINSINGKAPLLSGDNITVGTINGSTPALNGNDASFNNISVTNDASVGGDLTITGNLTVNGYGDSVVRRYVESNSVGGSLYSAIDEYYGLPISTSPEPIDIRMCWVSNGVYYFRHYTYTYTISGNYRAGGIYVSGTGISIFNDMYTSSAGGNFSDFMYIYV